MQSTAFASTRIVLFSVEYVFLLLIRSTLFNHVATYVTPFSTAMRGHDEIVPTLHIHKIIHSSLQRTHVLHHLTWTIAIADQTAIPWHVHIPRCQT